MKKYSIIIFFLCLVFANNLLAQKGEIKFQDASFPGGKDEMSKYFIDNLNLPNSVTVYKREGYVSILVTIDESGVVSNPRIISSYNSDCNDEAIRAVLSMPKWNPLIQRYKSIAKDVKIFVPFFIPMDKNFQFKRALHYFSEEKYHLAFLSAEKAIKDGSTNSELFKLMARICLKLNQQDISCAYLADGVNKGVAQCEDIFKTNCDESILNNYQIVIDKNKFNTYDTESDFNDQAIVPYIARNARYPSFERENGIQGSIVISFIVDENGKVLDSEIVKGLSPVLDRECLRLMDSLPKVTPATFNNVNVPRRYSTSVHFKLL